MSTDNIQTRSSVAGAVMGGAFGVVALVTGALLLRQYGPGNMWAGYIVGASIALLAMGIAFYRVWRNPAASTTAERALTPHADERDKAVARQAAAAVGAVSLPLTGVAAIVVAVGVDPAPVFAILLWAQLTLLVVAFVRANRAM